MVFSVIDELEPVVCRPGAEHPILMKALRVAGEPAGGEPVQIGLTESQTIRLIGKLVDALVAVKE